MFIVWGSGEGRSELGPLGEQECPTCGKQSVFNAVLSYSYAHLWYLLSWLTGRKYYAECSNCGAASLMGDQGAAKKAFPKDGVPFIRKRGWLFGAIPLTVFLAFIVVGISQDGAKTKEYLAAPQVNDLYFADMLQIPNSGFEPKGMRNVYAVMKLTAVDEGEYEFATAMEGYDKKKGVRDDLRSGKVKYDLDNPVYFKADELQKLYDSGVVYEIQRR